jgi:hypothetical protein
VHQVVKQIASGAHDRRPKLLALLKQTIVTRIVVAQRDRLTRCGFHYLHTLLEAQGRQVEVVNLETHGGERHGRPECRSRGACLRVHGTALWAAAGQAHDRADGR